MDTKLKTDLSISMTAANVLSLLIALSLISVLAGLYLLRWWQRSPAAAGCSGLDCFSP